MKTLFFSIGFLVLYNQTAFSQEGGSLTEKIINTYFEESKPYLKKLSESEYTDNLKNLRKQELIHSRYLALVAQAHLIGKAVRNELDQNDKGKLDKQAISKLVSSHYQKNFPKLSKEYWEILNKKILSL